MSVISWNRADSFPGNSSGADLTERRACPVCGADRPAEVLRMEDFQFFTDSSALPKRTTIREVQCTACHALYLNPAYTSRGFEILFAEAGCSYGATQGRPREQIEWLTEQGLLNAGQSLLDVGCYDGRFLSLIPQKVRRLGVDIDRPAIERGRLQYGQQGVELIHGDFNRFRLDTPPDTITMFHVLEHLPDPVATLKNLRSQAHGNTALVVEVPVLENGFTNDINGFFSAQHMTHFSRHSLANTLLRAGWSIVRQMEQPDYNGCRVLAHPATPPPELRHSEEDDLTLQRLLEHQKNAVGAVRNKLSALGGTVNVAVWGGGMHTEFLYQLTDLFRGSDRKFIIIDSDPLKQGKSWRGIEIYSPERIREAEWGGAKLLVSSYGGAPSIARAALACGVPKECMVTLYDEIHVY